MEPTIETAAPAATFRHRKLRLAVVAARLARLAFGLAVVLSPLRARIELLDRSDPPIYRDYTNFLLFWSDVAVLATIGLWALSLAAHRKPLSFGPFFLRWPIVVLLFSAWLSCVTSVDFSLSVYAALRMTTLATLALFAVNEFPDIRMLRPAVAAMVFVQAVVAIGQVLGQESIGWRSLGEHDLNPTTTDISTVISLDGDVFLRAYGLADHPNILGGLLGFGLLLLVASASSASQISRSLGTVVVGIGSLAMALTFSRGAILATTVAFVIGCGLLARSRRWPELRWWVAGALAALIVLAVVIEPYGEFFVARTDAEAISQIRREQRSLTARGDLVEATNELIIARPFLGTGLGAAPIAMRDAFPDFPYYYQPAHVVLLTATAEVGLLGGLAYSLMMVAPWLAVLARPRMVTPSLGGASAVLAAVTIVGLFDYYTWSYAPGQLWFWIAIGVWAASYEAARRG